RGEASLVWVGTYKLVQGLFLVVVATGILKAVDGDLQETLLGWVNALHLDADNHYIASLLQKADQVDGQKLKHLSGFSIAYGAIFMIEGVGLIFKQRWAEYVTLVITLSFVPIEIMEIIKHCSVAKVILLVVNLAIAVYLIVMLRRKPAE
ncbi:MAG: DUF2127 domain-containing protein, partial [Chthoniobacter sp.]